MRTSINLTFLFCILSLGIFSQFSRTYEHGIDGSDEISSYKLVAKNNYISTFHISKSGTNTLEIQIHEIDQTGKLVNFEKLPITLNSPLFQNVSLNAVSISGGNYFLLFTTTTNTNQQVVEIQIDTLSGSLINEYAIPENFLIGNNPVSTSSSTFTTYQYSSSGIKRVEIPFTAPSNYTVEIVDASVTTGGSYAGIVLNKFHGAIFEWNGQEAFYPAINGIPNLQVYSRLSPGVYTVNNFSYPMGENANAIKKLSNGNYLLMNALSTYLLNDQFGLIYERSTDNSKFAAVEEFNNQIYCLSIPSGSQSLAFDRRYPLDLSSIDSIPFFARQLGAYAILHGKLTSFGKIYTQTPQIGYNGLPLLANHKLFVTQGIRTGQSIFNEYGGTLQFHDIKLFYGIGSFTLSPNYESKIALSFKDSLITASAFINDLYLGYSNGQKRTSEQSVYEPYLQSEFAGPYTPAQYYNPVIESTYNRAYYVDKAMISAHIQAIQNGLPNYTVPSGIRDWPGNGDLTIGQAQQLAAFHDVNQDAVYDPMAGDYPIIYGDRCLFSITHQLSQEYGSAGIEIHAYLYQIDCDSVSEFRNVLFKKTKVFARAMDVDSLKLFNYQDLEAGGNYADDYAGTHVELGLTYFYNSDLFDESTPYSNGFGADRFSLGILSLKGAELPHNNNDDLNLGYANGDVNGYGFGDAILDNECFSLEGSLIPDPMNFNLNYAPQHFENFSFGMNMEGNQQFYATTTLPSKYIYPFDSDTLHYGTYGVDPGFVYNEQDPTGNGGTPNLGTDKKLFTFNGTTGRTLAIDDHIEFDKAFLLVHDTLNATSIWDGPEMLFAKALAMREAFLSNNSPCGAVFSPDESLAIPQQSELTFELYPNPAKEEFTVSGLIPQTLLQIYDLNGRIVFESMSEHDSISINTDKLFGSIYFVNCTRNGASQMKKLVIIK